MYTVCAVHTVCTHTVHIAVYAQNEYLGLVEQCMNFAYELMDLCRGTQEVEAVLSESRQQDDDSCATLARLKMAIEYEEKKVSRPNILRS